MSEHSSGSFSLTSTSFSPVSLALLSITFTEREAVSILSWEGEKGLKFRGASQQSHLWVLYFRWEGNQGYPSSEISWKGVKYMV